MRRVFAPTVAALITAGVLAGVVLAPAARSSPAEPLLPPGSLTVAIVDDAAGVTQPADVAGVGVHPSSRSADAFLAAVGKGAPDGDVSGVETGEPLALARALGSRTRIEATGRRAALLAYGGLLSPAGRMGADDRPTLRVVDGEDDAAAIVIAVPRDGRTPLRVLVRDRGPGLLAGGQSRRPGIVTPFDLSATLVAHFGAPMPAGFAGRPLHVGPGDAATADGIASKLTRDATFMQSLTVWTIVVGLGFGWILALAAAFAGRPEWSARLTVGGSVATLGFLIGLFVPSARGDVRALPMLALFVAAAALPWRDRELAAMRIFVVVAGATAALAAIAAADPGGPVAHALWGNPLVSWRLFGLQNFAAAFIAGGAVVALPRLGLRAAPLALTCLALIVVVGSPRIGANFVGVLTFAFGAALAVLAASRERLVVRDVAVAGVIALTAFAIALLADSGASSSHGGAAAREIGRGGIAAAWDLTLDRLRINVRALNAFPGGWIWAACFVGLYAAMIRHARSPSAHAGGRAGIAAGALMGLAALLLEDSGFKTTAVLGFPALLLWTFAAGGRPLFRAKTAGQPGRA